MDDEVQSVSRESSKVKLHACEVCQKRFTHKFSLKSHRLVHSGARPYACDICDRAFTQKSNLVRHKSLVHVKKHHCRACSKTFADEALLADHITLVHHHEDDEDSSERPTAYRHDSPRRKTHNDVQKASFRCTECDKELSSSRALRNHGYRHTREYRCDLCSRTFPTTSELAVHRRVHTREKPFECFVCFRRFADRSSLIKHERLHTGERSHTCDGCDKRFATLSGLRDHRRTHSSEMAYACEFCPRRFKQASNWLRHKKNMHLRPPRPLLLCRLCDVHFPTVRRLRFHCRDVHADDPAAPEEEEVVDLSLPSKSGAYAYACESCDNKFRTYFDLAKHKVVHAGASDVARYQCERCLQTYATPEQLFVHRADVHARRKRCRLCPKMFNSVAARDRHQLTHDSRDATVGHKTAKRRKEVVVEEKAVVVKVKAPSKEERMPIHECLTCGRTFLRKRSLVAHRRLHQETQRFSCPACGMAFPWQATLDAHLRSHSDERPFECSSCDASFRRKHHLSRHQASAHSSTSTTFPCKACDAVFAAAKLLFDHLDDGSCEVHLCRVCLKTFPSAVSLRAHSRSHPSTSARRPPPPPVSEVTEEHILPDRSTSCNVIFLSKGVEAT